MSELEKTSESIPVYHERNYGEPRTTGHKAPTKPKNESHNERIERIVNLWFALMVLGAFVAVGYCDFVVQSISLGYLYILPLVLTAFVFPLRVSLGLALVSFILQDVFGPYAHSAREHVARNAFTLVAFITVVIVVDRLVTQRRGLRELVRIQRDELAREIELAAHVQQRLLPAHSPYLTGFDIAGQMVAARTVGGDYFDYFKLSAESLGLVIADVSGKGVAASLLMASVEMALRMDVTKRSQPNELIGNLNKALFQVTEAERYATLFYGNLDATQRTLQYTNAGHTPPLLLRARTGEAEWLETGGTVVGLIPEAHYDFGQVQLNAGDTLVLYTDGVTEATNPNGEEFGRERLVELVAKNPKTTARDLIDSIESAVSSFSGIDSFEDDLTLLIVKLTSVRSAPSTTTPGKLRRSSTSKGVAGD